MTLIRYLIASLNSRLRAIVSPLDLGVGYGSKHAPPRRSGMLEYGRVCGWRAMHAVSLSHGRAFLDGSG
jgi:hypothetical protein